MKLVTSAQMREIDRLTIDEHGVPGKVLMARAGRGVADLVTNLLRSPMYGRRRVLFFAGHGNNGGDAFVAAAVVAARGYETEVWLTCTRDALQGDALFYFDRMAEAGVPWHERPDESEWGTLPPLASPERFILVDGLLGTGLNGAARGVSAAAIEVVNRLGASDPVVAIDIPSGLDADTGVAEGVAVLADHTVTMGLPKRGCVTPSASDYVGQLSVVDIGVPAELCAAGDDDDLELITPGDLRAWFPRRTRDYHKGDAGHVVVIGGAPGYTGAPTMAARAALRGGAGLVSVLVPRSVAPVIAAGVPEAMVHPADETDTGTLATSCLGRIREMLHAADAVLVGPGLSTELAIRQLVTRVVLECSVPLVVDADGLNVLAGSADRFKLASCPVVLTPHPGEMARIADARVPEIQADRLAVSRRLAQDWGVTIALKGSGTVVAGKDRCPWINKIGNPGMASGGMGDALGGLLAALLGQGMPAFEATVAAVYLHARAADLAALAGCEAGLIATDVIEALPRAIAEVAVR